MNRHILSALLLLLLVVRPADGQISVGPTGSGVQTFNALPTVAEGWSTLSVGSAAGAFSTAASLDSHVITNTAAALVTGTVGSSATVNPLSANAIARWNSVNLYLQTRTTGNDHLLLLARLRNDTGSNVVALSVSYAYGVDPAATPVEEIPGHRVFWSQIGLPGSWQLLPALSGVAVSSNLSASLTVNWPAASNLFLLWADDNAVGTEGAYTLDNFQVAATPATAPAITIHPQPQTVSPGGSVSFFAGAFGATPMFFQWRKDGADLPGATNQTLLFNNAQAADSGDYSLAVSNAFGVAVSSNAALAVGCFVPVAITAPPVGQTVLAGNTLNLSVGVSGSLPFTYQWLRNSLPIAGATNATYARTNVLNPDSGLYSAIVANCGGSVTSAPVVVSVPEAPFTLLGLTNHFWRYDQSNTDLGSAWRAPGYDDSAWPSGRGVFAREDLAVLQTLTNTVLSLTNNSPSQTPAYYFRTQFVFTNDPVLIALVASNYFDDGAVFYLNGVEAFRFNMPESAIGHDTLALAANPQGEGNFVVTNLPLHLLVPGTNTLAVQVHQNSLTSSDVAFGSELRVIPLAPTLVQITGQPADQTVVEGTNVTLTAGVSGVAARLQWFKDGVPVPGANTSALQLTAVGSADAGGYFLVASNAINSATTRVAVVTVQLDLIPPALLDAEWLDATHLLAIFSETLLPNAATNLARYALTNTLGGALALTKAVLTNGTNVLLTTALSNPTVNYILTAGGIPDTSQSQNLLPLSALPVARWLTLVPFDATWDYYEPFPMFGDPEPGPEWRSNPAYDLSFWGQGAGAFRFSIDESLGTPVPTGTVLNQTPTHTLYFRNSFLSSGVSPGGLRLTLRSYVNDAVVFYLNGVELARTNLPDGAITSSTPALVSAGSVLVPCDRDIAPSAFLAGTNLFAAELHQFTTSDSQKIFAAELRARAESLLTGPLVLVSGPADATVLENRPATFTVRSAAASFFQWQINGGDISGATNSTITFPALLALDGAQVRCVLSRPGTNLVTAPATLLVVADTARPALLSALATDDGTITLVFNELLDAASATNAANYVVTNELGQTLFISGLCLTNGSSVVLQVAGLPPGRHGVTVNNVRDTSAAANSVLPGTTAIAGYSGRVLRFDSWWRYDAAGVDRGAAPVWSAPAYNDAAWTGDGQGLFAAERGVPPNGTGGSYPAFPEPVRTSISLSNAALSAQISTHYFRARFVTSSGGTGQLALRLILDDGAVVHLNGKEIFRLGVANNVTPIYTTLANRTVGDAGVEGPFIVAITNLVAGTNVLAVEVHPVNLTSADVAFALQADLQLTGRLLPVVESAPVLQVGQQGGQIILTWDGSGVLESAPAPTGPWNVVPGGSPRFVTPANSTEFFRVRR